MEIYWHNPKNEKGYFISNAQAKIIKLQQDDRT